MNIVNKNIIIGILCMSLFHCVPKKVTTITDILENNSVTTEEKLAQLELLLGSESKDPNVPTGLTFIGEELRLNGKLSESRDYFERLALEHPSHPLKANALIGMGLIDLQRNPQKNIEQILLQNVNKESVLETLKSA